MRGQGQDGCLLGQVQEYCVNLGLSGSQGLVPGADLELSGGQGLEPGPDLGLCHEELFPQHQHLCPLLPGLTA